MSKLEELYNYLEIDRKKSPWSRKSTVESRYEELLSEVNEIKEAIKNKDIKNLKEEIGDTLWDILSLMIIAEDEGLFKKEDVIQGAIDKLKRRKPWIFTDEELSMDEEIKRWYHNKSKEKNN